ncbi:MAG TPA: hypothetical protein VE665_00035 [Hyphomicrobiaceae bacterium]|nr:hypothetical protein [Hyphomicrobiaceae bacterium]
MAETFDLDLKGATVASHDGVDLVQGWPVGTIAAGRLRYWRLMDNEKEDHYQCPAVHRPPKGKSI